MCATPRPKRQAVLAVLAADVAAHAAFFAVPTVVSKAIPSAPMPGAVVGAPTSVAALPAAVAKKSLTVDGAPAPVATTLKVPVAREAKAPKECAPVMADVAAPAEVVAAPAPLAKAPGPFIRPVLWWISLGWRWVTRATLVKSMPATEVR
jgi:hypothetical protein